MDYTPALACRCCGSADLEPVLDLGRQPLANSYTRELADLPAYPLVLAVCRACFHGQLSVVVNPDLMFRHYLYVSGTSRTLREHFASLAREASAWASPGPGECWTWPATTAPSWRPSAAKAAPSAAWTPPATWSPWRGPRASR